MNATELKKLAKLYGCKPLKTENGWTPDNENWYYIDRKRLAIHFSCNNITFVFGRKCEDSGICIQGYQLDGNMLDIEYYFFGYISGHISADEIYKIVTELQQLD